MKTTIQVLCLVFLFSCQVTEPEAPMDDIDRALIALNSNLEKKAYLEEIFKEDQKYRQDQSSILMQRYGKDSEKYVNFMEVSDRNDSLNLVKVERYIQKFGHPKRIEIGELAAQTPWAVIHHSNDYEARSRNFDVLYQAYKNEDIDGGAFGLYLERMYNLKFRQRFEMERDVFIEQEKIGTLMRLLELSPKK